MDPIQLAQVATEEALADAQVAPESIEAVVFIDMGGEFRLPRKLYPAYDNPALSLSRACGLDKASRFFKSELGGNMPQYCVNECCERIVAGEFSSCLISGAEAIDTLMRGLKRKFRLSEKEASSEAGKVLHWGSRTGVAPEALGSKAQVTGVQDLLHDLTEMPAAYALIESATQRADGVGRRERAAGNGRMFHGYSKVAAYNENRKHSWFPVERAADEVATVSDSNRLVAGEHRKLNCAIMDVNQAASVLLMSDARARELGVPREKWVYLHGGADCNDVGVNVLQKPRFDRCPGMGIVGDQVFRAARVAREQIAFYDVYSCFPIAVRLACREMRLPLDPESDGERLTVTGGLPFHGGPGNNYVMHAIAAMVQKLRANPGKFGLVTANGGVLSKHAAGIYSTEPYATTHPELAQRWASRPDCSVLLEEERKRTPPRVSAKAPVGQGRVTDFVVRYGSGGKPVSVTALGEVLDGPDKGKRFVAKSTDDALLALLVGETPKRDLLGDKVRLASNDVTGKGKVFQTSFELDDQQQQQSRL